MNIESTDQMIRIIFERRDLLGLTNYSLAKRTGVGRSFLGKLESGKSKSIDFSNLLLLCKELDINIRICS